MIAMDIDRTPGTDIAPVPDPACRLCKAEDQLIEGDGTIVCRPCLSFLGHVARDPMLASIQMRDYLADTHADVVELVRITTHAGQPELEWQWAGDWPGVTP